MVPGAGGLRGPTYLPNSGNSQELLSVCTFYAHLTDLVPAPDSHQTRAHVAESRAGQNSGRTAGAPCPFG